MTKMQANGSEARVGLALGHCQVGDPESALTVLLDVEDDRPYTSAVKAVAHGMLGDADLAIEHADRVVRDDGSTYLDRVLADISAGASHLRKGDRDLATERLARADDTAQRAGDEVAKALAQCARAILLGDVDGSDVEHLGLGWHRVIEGLADNAPREAGEAVESVT